MSSCLLKREHCFDIFELQATRLVSLVVRRCFEYMVFDLFLFRIHIINDYKFLFLLVIQCFSEAYFYHPFMDHQLFSAEG